jgi:hypothetical protein
MSGWQRIFYAIGIVTAATGSVNLAFVVAWAIKGQSLAPCPSVVGAFVHALLVAR